MAENFLSSLSLKELCEALLKLAEATGEGAWAGSIGAGSAASEYCLVWISIRSSKFGCVNDFKGRVKVRIRVNRSFEAIVEVEKTRILISSQPFQYKNKSVIPFP